MSNRVSFDEFDPDIRWCERYRRSLAILQNINNFFIFFIFFIIFKTRRTEIKRSDILRELESSDEYNLLMNEESEENPTPKDDDKPSETSEEADSLSQWHRPSLWLNCFISRGNIKYYLLGNLFLSFGLLSGISLSSATVCDNFVIFHIFKNVDILAPQNCCGVFDHFQ